MAQGHDGQGYKITRKDTATQHYRCRRRVKQYDYADQFDNEPTADDDYDEYDSGMAEEYQYSDAESMDRGSGLTIMTMNLRNRNRISWSILQCHSHNRSEQDANLTLGLYHSHQHLTQLYIHHLLVICWTITRRKSPLFYWQACGPCACPRSEAPLQDEQLPQVATVMLK